MSVCVCVTAAVRDGPVEIYITKHPQVHREISMIQMEAESIKERFQDVRGGERKGEWGGWREGVFANLPGCTQRELDLKGGVLPFKDERVATLQVNRVLRYLHATHSLRNESA